MPGKKIMTGKKPKVLKPKKPKITKPVPNAVNKMTVFAPPTAEELRIERKKNHVIEIMLLPEMAKIINSNDCPGIREFSQ